MIICEPIFGNPGESIEFVFAWRETELLGTYEKYGRVFEFDGWSGSVYFSSLLIKWLKEEVGEGNYHISYCMGYRIRFKNKSYAMRFRLEWL